MWRWASHLIGNGEQPCRKTEAEYSGGLEVDHELELGRLYDRKVGGLLALENPAGVHTGLAICVGDACSVAHQTADFGRNRSQAPYGRPPALVTTDAIARRAIFSAPNEYPTRRFTPSHP